jgi:hypothetical protein
MFFHKASQPPLNPTIVDTSFYVGLFRINVHIAALVRSRQISFQASDVVIQGQGKQSDGIDIGLQGHFATLGMIQGLMDAHNAADFKNSMACRIQFRDIDDSLLQAIANVGPIGMVFPTQTFKSASIPPTTTTTWYSIYLLFIIL